ncbi:MAG: hypothetical protein ACRYHQ_09995 [Janthinobacterium lividum]
MTDQQTGTGQQAAPPPEGPPRAHHDMGGIPKFLCEGIDTGPHTLTEFDRTVDALRGILGAKGVMSVDELRRGIEAIPEADYLRLTYYERWIRSIADNLMARGVVTAAELRAALDAA